MNPQPHPIVGQFGVLIFALLIAYFALTNNKKKKQFNFDDQFVIGYINDNKPSYCNVIERDMIKPKYNEEIIKPTYNEKLYNDCVACLIALGSKKKQATQTAKDIFEKHSPNNLQEFINLAYKK